LIFNQIASLTTDIGRYLYNPYHEMERDGLSQTNFNHLAMHNLSNAVPVPKVNIEMAFKLSRM